MCSTPADGSAECVHGQCWSPAPARRYEGAASYRTGKTPATTYRIMVFLLLCELAGPRNIPVHLLDQLVDRVELDHSPDMADEVDPHVLAVQVEIVETDGVRLDRALDPVKGRVGPDRD